MYLHLRNRRIHTFYDAAQKGYINFLVIHLKDTPIFWSSNKGYETFLLYLLGYTAFLALQNGVQSIHHSAHPDYMYPVGWAFHKGEMRVLVNHLKTGCS